MEKSPHKRIRERPIPLLHGGGGERVPGDRETRYNNYDGNRENRN